MTYEDLTSNELFVLRDLANADDIIRGGVKIGDLDEPVAELIKVEGRVGLVKGSRSGPYFTNTLDALIRKQLIWVTSDEVYGFTRLGAEIFIAYVTATGDDETEQKIETAMASIAKCLSELETAFQGYAECIKTKEYPDEISTDEMLSFLLSVEADLLNIDF